MRVERWHWLTETNISLFQGWHKWTVADQGYSSNRCAWEQSGHTDLGANWWWGSRRPPNGPLLFSKKSHTRDATTDSLDAPSRQRHFRLPGNPFGPDKLTIRNKQIMLWKLRSNHKQFRLQSEDRQGYSAETDRKWTVQGLSGWTQRGWVPIANQLAFAIWSVSLLSQSIWIFELIHD